jgi:hypothetical protein
MFIVFFRLKTNYEHKLKIYIFAVPSIIIDDNSTEVDERYIRSDYRE